ncbi:hypothetical protein VMCG_02369 [Cytospora schulzeri]|uniref:4Fe-4S ferredoxin-type domain-containing protein n=1 Tax=Cytospora schulzeri TaxID=448051 RepID=A0A423X166_9PEZI|nr:hypothetical protein VMCG_02369 [Valsa malicola]
MKVNTIHFVLAAITSTVTSIEVGSDIAKLPLELALAPDAVDTLHAHGLWAPDPDSFNRGQPNVDGVDATAENLKFEEAGVDINELVSISVNNQTTAAVGRHMAAAMDYDCKRCHTCTNACLAILICGPCWFICQGACLAQEYCKGPC